MHSRMTVGLAAAKMPASAAIDGVASRPGPGKQPEKNAEIGASTGTAIC